MFSFAITDRDGSARRGRLNTPHGVVDTPAFMPVGTAGAVKGVTPRQLRNTTSQMILANTYHLQLRPTAEVVAQLGGLHRFMGWDGPILTDSGGYQVFSLARLRKISDDGVAFQSHIDGAELRLDPRRAMDIQVKLGADVIMAFDHCPALPCDNETLSAAVDRTIRWAALCKELHCPGRQALFGIVQGGLDLALRRRCLEAIVDMEFDGYAVGGLSVGETHDEMLAVLDPIASALPANRPRYLMGVGTPRDIVEAVRVGVDMFDCTLPTRNGRNTWAFTAGGLVKLRNEKHRQDDGPLEAGCDCETCQRFSRGYIRHLFNVGEMLGPTLTSIHNLRFYQRLMARIRELIREGRLAGIVDEFPIASEGAHQPNHERSP